ncbi:hypothetical protein DMENIID0001_027350 [Sergentomyia squamirostris]
MTLDYRSDNCNDFLAYIANFFGNYLTVYDYKKDDFWTIEGDPSFQPIIAESYLVYDNYLNYQLPAGLTDIVLGYPDKYGDRTAHYIAVASTAQYAVSTKFLKNQQ